MYDAIIVGAGPVGSYLAGRLAGLGNKTLVLERKPAAGEDICCTGIVGLECLKLLSLDDNLILRRASSARFFVPSGGSLRLCRDDDVACIIDRPALERTLAERARAAGVSHLFGAQVMEIRPEAEGVSIEADSCGQRRLFEARAAIIATGFGSPLPEKLGLGKITDFLVGAQAEVALNGLDEVEIYFDQCLAPGAFAWLVPTRDGKGLAGLMTRRQPVQNFRKLLSLLKTQGKIVTADVTPRYGSIPLRPLPRTYADRVLVVGEAAGQVKPTTGGGIYYGLLCADMAALTLHQAFLSNDLSGSSLASYQKRWRARLGKEQQVGYLAHRVYGKAANRHIERLYGFISRNGVAQLVAEADEFSFDWHGDLILKMLRHLAVALPLELVKSTARRHTKPGKQD